MTRRFDPDQQRELEQRLATRLELLAPRPRSEALERLRAQIAMAPQRHGVRARIAERKSPIAWGPVAASTAVFALALVIGIVIGSSGWLPVGKTPTVSGAPAVNPSPARSNTALATPTPGPSQVTSLPQSRMFAGWERVAMPDPTPHTYGGEAAADVVAFKGGYIAVGGIFGGCCTGAYTTDTRAAVWRSADGVHWELEPHRPAFALGTWKGS
jgi:hypothetical protein